MIKNVLIVGLGAIGGIFASKFFKKNITLKILVDEDRLKKYRNDPTIINEKEYSFDFMLPTSSFKADLILIATKNSSFEWAVQNIQNFMGEKTILMSLLNGIESEEILRKIYPQHICLDSFWWGASVRVNRKITHDDLGYIVYGAEDKAEELAVQEVQSLFDQTNVRYQISADIKTALWQKYLFNVSINEVTALYEVTYGEILQNEKMISLFQQLMTEVQMVAHHEGVELTEKMKQETVDILKKQRPSARTSMCQDVLAKRKTEVDIFAGTLIKKAKKYGIAVPCVELVYRLIKEKEEKF